MDRLPSSYVAPSHHHCVRNVLAARRVGGDADWIALRILESKAGLSLRETQLASAASTYLAGAVTGALLFGYLTDRPGRKRLFMVTLATYSLATIATAFSHDYLLMFTIFRFFTGLGIGGEYAAINSAVGELIPSKVRGTADLAVNATFWVGAAIGCLATVLLLHDHLLLDGGPTSTIRTWGIAKP